jgi:nucleotidyltransferase substrate binding protein (TIGR01987 family)
MHRPSAAPEVSSGPRPDETSRREASSKRAKPEAFCARGAERRTPNEPSIQPCHFEITYWQRPKPQLASKKEVAQSMTDIRWHQRLNNFGSALKQLSSAVQIAQSRKLSDLEKQGLIQAFEFTHELAWNVLKDYFEYQGQAALITGSRDATREAFRMGLVSDGDTWMEMIKSRNQTSHTYNQSVADDIADKIIRLYSPLFLQLQKTLEGLKTR